MVKPDELESGGVDEPDRNDCPETFGSVLGTTAIGLLLVLALLLMTGATRAGADPYRAKYIPRPVPAWTREGVELRGFTLEQMKDLLQLDADHDLLRAEVEKLRLLYGLAQDRLTLHEKERGVDVKLQELAEARIKMLEEEKAKLEVERNRLASRPRLAAHWKTPLLLGLLCVAGGLYGVLR